MVRCKIDEWQGRAEDEEIREAKSVERGEKKISPILREREREREIEREIDRERVLFSVIHTLNMLQ